MLWARGAADITKRTEEPADKKPLMWTGSVGSDVEHFEQDRAIHTDPEEINHRRTIQLTRRDGTWGFTLQTYVIKNKKTGELEVTTFVDYVELNGPAHVGGLQRGSVILSVNGESVETDTHKDLCHKIRSSGKTMRLVVLTGNCTKKIELYERFLKLKSLLLEKMDLLRKCEQEERDFYRDHSLSRLSAFRESIRSSTSSDWDRYSLMVSPAPSDGPYAFFQRGQLSVEGAECSSQRSVSARTLSDSASQISLDAANESFSDSDSSCFVSTGFYLGPAGLSRMSSQESSLRRALPGDFPASTASPDRSRPDSATSRGTSGLSRTSSLPRGEKSASSVAVENGKCHQELPPPENSLLGKRYDHGVLINEADEDTKL